MFVWRRHVRDHLLDHSDRLGPLLDPHLYPLALGYCCVFECRLCLGDDLKRGVLKPEGQSGVEAGEACLPRYVEGLNCKTESNRERGLVLLVAFVGEWVERVVEGQREVDEVALGLAD